MCARKGGGERDEAESDLLRILRGIICKELKHYFLTAFKV